MKDYAEVCIVMRKTLRDAYELANEGKIKQALEEAKFLSALADQLVATLKK
jgi:soluble cytochrome b562